MGIYKTIHVYIFAVHKELQPIKILRASQILYVVSDMNEWIKEKDEACGMLLLSAKPEVPQFFEGIILHPHSFSEILPQSS